MYNLKLNVVKEHIRSIAHDLGAELNCGGYLSELKRIAVGEYNLTKKLVGRK